jgi:glycosyltransferase involved in cell wall biosynthesis
MAPIYINGKFCARRMTGVQRVATCLLLALDALPGIATRRWTLLVPPGGQPPALKRIAQRTVGPAGWPLHVWEQVTLPLAARDGLLINLSGSAPAFARRQWALLHDAAVFDHPEAYTTAFVAWYRWLFRRLARRAERLFTVSAFSRERLARCLGVDPQRFTVLPNGADHLSGVAPDDTLLRRHGLLGAPFLLAVGSGNPTKNLQALVSAFSRLRRPGLRLVIAGGRNEFVFSGTSTAADPPGVLRLGPVDDSALKALYRAAVALVFPSTYEGFGLPTLEAMAEGCPVGAASAAALPGVCGDAALTFDPHRLDSIDAALRSLLDDHALRARLREAGPVRAAQFPWHHPASLLMGALGA